MDGSDSLQHEKLVVFLGETFFHEGRTYGSRTTNIDFHRAMAKDANIIVASPSLSLPMTGSPRSSWVKEQKFVPMPYYSSTEDFVLRVIKDPRYLMSYIRQIDNLVARHQGAIFWIRSPSIGSLLFGLRVLRSNQILVNHICADATNTWRDKRYSGWKRLPAFLSAKLIKICLARISKDCNTLNLATGSKLEAFAKAYAPNRTIQFVDLISRGPLSTTSRRTDRRLRTIFVGRVVEDKGIYDLINTIKLMDGNVVLSVVGAGDDLRSAKSLVQALNLQASVTFCGQLSSENVRKAISASDVLVVPSRNRYEGFPRVIMEAWAQGKPVVVSNVGGISAFVKDMDNGIIVSPGSVADIAKALRLIHCDGEVQNRLEIGAKSAQELASTDYWSKVARTAIIDHVANIRT